MKNSTLLVTGAIVALSFAAVLQGKSESCDIPLPNGQYVLVTGTFDNMVTTALPSAANELLVWNGTGYNSYVYYNTDDSPDGNEGWYDFNNVRHDHPMTALQTGFILNQSGQGITVTFSGQVVTGTPTIPVSRGVGLYGVPWTTHGPFDHQYITTPYINFPAVSSSTTCMLWTGSTWGQPVIYYNADDSPDGNEGWYDYAGNPQNNNPAFWPGKGHGFLINNPGTPLTWHIVN